MYAKVEKSKENKSRVVIDSFGQKNNNSNQGLGLVDRRPEIYQFNKLLGVCKGDNKRNEDHVMQRKIGFELELLTLVDVNGRPPPEKSYLGRYGAQNLELQVDHNRAVEGKTPTAARDADFKVVVKNPSPLATPTDDDFVSFGAYDLRHGEQTRVGQNPEKDVVADPRPVGGDAALLTPKGWALETVQVRYNRPPNDNNTRLDNTKLATLDKLIENYFSAAENWEVDKALNSALKIYDEAEGWLAANNDPPDEATFHFLQNRRRARYLAAQVKLRRVRDESERHARFWRDPVNANIPVHMTRLFRPRTMASAHIQDFGPRHPLAGGGGDRYASILEIVTQAYNPETITGLNDLVTAMGEAVTLANDIKAKTHEFTIRVKMDTIDNVTVFNPQTFVGNDNETSNPQSTDASIQSTFALDLSQIASFVKSTVGIGPQSRFITKHQSDVKGGGRLGVDGKVNRSDHELYMAMKNATDITNDLKAKIGVGAPNFVNLRGLLILVCQYLRMGKYWKDVADDRSLDKNIANLLSRTDLSQQFNRLVPLPEKRALTPVLSFLYSKIIQYSGRKPDSALFNNHVEELTGPRHIQISCQKFVENVFIKDADGVTKLLGGFKKLNPESVDPESARSSDTRDLNASQREGAVFELRNMIPKLNGAERFQVGEWVHLAQYMAKMLAILNARKEAAATQDVVVQDQSRVNVEADGLAPAMAAPNVNVIRTDTAW